LPDEEQDAALAAAARQELATPVKEAPDPTAAAAAQFADWLGLLPDDREVNEARDDPHRLARIYADAHLRGEVCLGNPYWVRRLVRWQGQYYRWEGAAYRPLAEAEVNGEIVATIKREFDRLNGAELRAWVEAEAQAAAQVGKGKGKGKGHPNPRPTPRPVARAVTRTVVSDTLQALASLTLLPERVRPPAWIGPTIYGWSGPASPGPAPARVLACRNCLLDLAAYDPRVSERVGLYPPTPRFFSPTALDVDFDPHAPPPNAWLAFLKELWGEDGAAVRALQEWFGYCLTPDTRQQKILLLIGPKRSGKGTIARLLRALLGEENTASPTLASLGTNFGLQPLLGKTLAVISDARLGGRIDLAQLTERLLSVSGEDAQTIDRKYQSQVTCTLPTRFMILTNELPQFDDASGAVAGRMVVLELTRSFYGKEDPGLTDRLKKELPGILLWAIAGWRSLRKRGHFAQPASGQDAARQLAELASPVRRFLDERCALGPDREVLTTALYAAWCSWCAAAGKKPGSDGSFGKQLRAATGVTSKQRKVPGGGGAQERVYPGVGLLQPALTGWPPGNG
jgi:putative DNA primase/helicase